MVPLFDNKTTAAGYVSDRPALHGVLIERTLARLGRTRWEFALDAGCGTGLSTLPLAAAVRFVVGLDPAEAMLRHAPRVHPNVSWLAARAEQIPLRTASTELVSAMGSLNWIEQPPFFAESARVLRRGGYLAISDFAEGRSFLDSPALEEWYDLFLARYPKPPRATPSPGAPAGFQALPEDRFSIDLPFTCDRYRRYVLTQSNVSVAGGAREAVEQWCADTLRPVFGGETRLVRFPCYVLAMRRV